MKSVEISIGTVEVFAIGRNNLNILNRGRSPCVALTMEHVNDRWEAAPPLLHYSIAGKEKPAPPGLLEELVTMGRTWAESHPEEFDRAGDREFSAILESCDEMFDYLVKELDKTENDFREQLREPEFVRQAPAMLRSRFEDSVKMVHAMKLQIEAAAEVLSDAAYEKRAKGGKHNDAKTQ